MSIRNKGRIFTSATFLGPLRLEGRGACAEKQELVWIRREHDRDQLFNSSFVSFVNNAYFFFLFQGQLNEYELQYCFLDLTDELKGRD